jgi:hypothetical protein
MWEAEMRSASVAPAASRLGEDRQAPHWFMTDQLLEDDPDQARR